MLPDDKRHGTVAGYSVHRRQKETACAPCKAAMAKDWKRRSLADYAPTVVDATGTIRRIQALTRMGWTWQEITDAGGPSIYALRRIGKFDRVSVTNRDKTLRAFRVLVKQLPPDRPRRGHVVNRAVRNEFVSALAWDDIDNIDEKPNVGAARQNFTRDELLDEWDHLRRSGLSMRQAAERLGITVDAIEKALERGRKDDAA